MRRLVGGLVVLNLLALAATGAAAWFLDLRSATELRDAATYVGLGMGAIGALMFFGSASGTGASTGLAASAADQPSRLMEALWGDRAAGISTGALFVVGGLLWLAMSWLLVELVR
ncbi:hypothetical protein [Microvirga subterranea]|uniref:Uncharacterized protein n=1 Tax=Microvirga subterranea TaxID=186651 RepID=A0A370HUT0_9HYPH|nr:hypothetical protein [Microvirga subterranea]RDI62262.1 hypothetical protein DES45_101530 [Microvirga subterranea]